MRQGNHEGGCRDTLTKITDVHIDRLRPFQASRT
jgi:hypothetical protein